MSTQPPAPPSSTPESNPTPAPPAVEQPKTQQVNPNRRNKWPMWAQQLPSSGFPKEPNPNFRLIDINDLRESLKNKDAEAVRRIEDDINYLEHEMLRLFRERDHRASSYQNRYRGFQIIFLVLSAFATLTGSLQALFLDSQPNLVPWFAFLTTIIALFTAYFSTLSGRESSLQLFLTNRQRAEALRREYFRYLMLMPPYDIEDEIQRKLIMSQRAANINRGVDPQDAN